MKPPKPKTADKDRMQSVMGNNNLAKSDNLNMIRRTNIKPPQKPTKRSTSSNIGAESPSNQKAPGTMKKFGESIKKKISRMGSSKDNRAASPDTNKSSKGGSRKSITSMQKKMQQKIFSYSEASGGDADIAKQSSNRLHSKAVITSPTASNVSRQQSISKKSSRSRQTQDVISSKQSEVGRRNSTQQVASKEKKVEGKK